MNKQKALIVASVSSMIEQFTLPYLELLKNNNYEVHIACNFKSGGNINKRKNEELISILQSKDIVMHQVNFKRNITDIKSIYFAYKEMQLIMKNNYTLVHAHSPIGGVLARITGKKYRKKGLRIFYTAHGFHFYRGAPILNWIIFYPIEKYLSRFTDVLITINEEDYNTAIRKKFKSNNIQRFNGVGVSLNTYKRTSIDSKFKHELGLKESDFTLTYVAELNNNKNQKVLIRMMNHISSQYPNIKLLLVGKGENYEEYDRMIAEYNLFNSVFLLGYRSDISKILSITDIYVASSIREGLPVNIIEAKAAGLPIVASNNRGHRELVIAGTGFLVDYEDELEFKKRIIELYNDEKLRKNFGNQSKFHSKKYSLDIAMEKYEKLI